MKRSTKALNWLFKKNKAKDLIVPKSTIDICLKMICFPHVNHVKGSHNQLSWDPNFTTERCQNCSGSDCFDDLKHNSIEGVR